MAYFTDGEKAGSEKAAGWRKMDHKIMYPLFPFLLQLAGSGEAEPESLNRPSHLVLWPSPPLHSGALQAGAGRGDF